METPLKELERLEKLTSESPSKGKGPTIIDSLHSLLQSLKDAKASLESGADEDALTSLTHAVEARKKEVDERQKEVYGSLSRLGKALDKVRPEQRYTDIVAGSSPLTEISRTFASIPLPLLLAIFSIRS